MEKLRDIKDIVEVPDNSLWLLLCIIVASLVIVAVLIYLYKNRRIRRKKPSKKQIARENLLSIDYSDTKNIAYTFSENFILFLDENNKKEFETLEQKLQEYKYKKEVQDLPQELKDKIKEMIKATKC